MYKLYFTGNSTSYIGDFQTTSSVIEAIKEHASLNKYDYEIISLEVDEEHDGVDAAILFGGRNLRLYHIS